LDAGFHTHCQALCLAVALALSCWYLLVRPTYADSFVIEDGQAVTVQQVLDGDGETGIIELGGSLETVSDDAILVAGESVLVSNGGSISTMGGSSHGIYSSGDNANITNSGSISAGSVGIGSNGDNANITNSGGISAGAGGIAIYADNANITNSGSIVAGYAGIALQANNVNIVNSGSVSADFRGINFSFLDNVNITNSGRILAYDGIYAVGIENVNVTNSGSISAFNGIGIFGDNVKITNSGNISARSFGIASDAENANITNTGSISAFRGISALGDKANITNSGSIFSEEGRAIDSGLFPNTFDQTLNILPGSRILGRIDLGMGAGDIANIYGSFGSAALTFDNTEIINVLTPNAVRIGTTDTVVVIDPTVESVTANTLNTFTTGIHNVINRRMQHTPATKPVQLAALELSPGMVYQERAPVLWGQAFGQNSERDGEGQTLAYDHDYRGVIGGYERDYESARVGLVAGAARADTDSAMFNQDTDSVFIGVYGHAYLGKVKLTASLLAGLEDHETKRQVLDNINGYETAKSDKDSYFLSPSFTLSSAYTLDPEVEFRPSATLTYTVGRYDSYEETGTTNANLDVDSRTVHALGTQLQLEWAKIIKGGEINMRLGAQSRHTGGDDIAGNLGGANFKYAAMSDSDVAGAFAGWGIRQEIKDKLSVLADLEVGRFSGDEEYVAGQVTLEYRF